MLLRFAPMAVLRENPVGLAPRRQDEGDRGRQPFRAGPRRPEPAPDPSDARGVGSGRRAERTVGSPRRQPRGDEHERRQLRRPAVVVCDAAEHG